MLRASSNETGRRVDLGAVADPFGDPLLVGGRELLAFTDAAILHDADEIATARRSLVVAVGESGATRAAAIAGNFQMMNRLLDALGVRVGHSALAVADGLGVQVPAHLRPN